MTPSDETSPILDTPQLNHEEIVEMIIYPQKIQMERLVELQNSYSNVNQATEAILERSKSVLNAFYTVTNQDIDLDQIIEKRKQKLLNTKFCCNKLIFSLKKNYRYLSENHDGVIKKNSTKNTKNRSIDFVVHEDLECFCIPEGEYQWENDKIDAFIKSLFR